MSYVNTTDVNLSTINNQNSQVTNTLERLRKNNNKSITSDRSFYSKKYIFNYSYTERSFLERNLNNPRNFGISETQSSNTYRNSVKTYSIPKEERFKDYVKPATDCFYNLPSIKSPHGAAIGFGSRIDLSAARGKGCPGPDAYNIGSTLNTKIAASLKSRLPDNSLLYKDKIPAPSNYNYQFKNTTLPTTLKFRHGLYYEDELKLKGHCISPQTYNPSILQVKQNRFKDIKFGTEQRSSTGGKNGVPGPGQYNLPSSFDLSRKYKPCIN